MRWGDYTLLLAGRSHGDLGDLVKNGPRIG